MQMSNSAIYSEGLAKKKKQPSECPACICKQCSCEECINHPEMEGGMENKMEKGKEE